MVTLGSAARAGYARYLDGKLLTAEVTATQTYNKLIEPSLATVTSMVMTGSSTFCQN
jgi:hypothetical protein